MCIAFAAFGFSVVAKNVFLLLVAGVNLWQAFRAERCGFEVQVGTSTATTVACQRDDDAGTDVGAFGDAV